jgi:hypothetical protein
LELEFRLLEFSTAEFKKNPTGISGIKNGIGIPLPMGVPEMGTKNQNSQPRKNVVTKLREDYEKT